MDHQKVGALGCQVQLQFKKKKGDTVFWSSGRRVPQQNFVSGPMEI